MTLLAPWALWLSLIALPIVALYLLRIRRTRQTVPALEFWQALAETSRVRSLFDRLKRLLSMLLWLLIAACLLLAVGNPVLSLGRIRPQSIVLIVDNSASMQTRESDGREGEADTRLERAKAAVARITSRRPVNDEWLLIEAGRTLRVAQSWTRDAGLVRDAAERIQPHLGETSLEEAVQLAGQLLAGRQRPAIVILSDGNDGEMTRLAGGQAGREDVIPWPIGAATDNVGVTRLSVRLHQQRAAHYAFVQVLNASDEPVEANLALSLDGVTTAVEPLRVPPGAAWEKTLALDFPQGGVLRAWIERPDALPEDNEAFAILPPIKPARVLLVSRAEEAFFVQQALTAMSPVVDIEASATVPPERFSPQLLAEMSPDLMVFNNWAPASVPDGASVFINAWPDDVPARTIGTLDHPRLVVELPDHPLMSFITLRGSSVARASRVELTDRATVLVGTGDGEPLVFLAQQPEHDALCIGFDVLESDLPFRNGFPLLLRNAVGDLVARQRAWVKDQYAVGDVIRSLRSLPEGVDQVTVARRAAADVEAEEIVPVAEGHFEFRDTAAVGPIRFDFGDQSAYAAVNIASAAETRIAPAAADDAAERLGLSRSLLGGVPWFVLALVAAVLVGAEWLTYHLRWTE